MSRKKAAAPKPEELIQILDDKLEAFKAEILASLEEKANDISNLQEAYNEEKNKTEGVVAELKEEMSKNKEENDLWFRRSISSERMRNETRKLRVR